MAVILRRGALTAASHYGGSKPIPTWLGYLSSSKGHSLLVQVFRQNSSNSNNNNNNNNSSNPLHPQIYYRIYKPHNLRTTDTSKSKERNLLGELEILSKQQSKPNRHDLQSKLETLEAFGCSMDQIEECPEILQISLTEIVKRASVLKKIGHEHISVQLLKGIRFNMSRLQLRQKIKALEPMMNYSTMTKYMQDVLQFTHAEMHAVLQKVPNIKAFRNMAAFSEKVKYLRSEGLTTEDLKTYPAIICRSLTILQHRTNVIKEVREDKNFPVASLVISDKQFERFLVLYEADQKILKGHEDRDGCIAHLFGVPKMIESQLHYFNNRRLATVKPRIDYLLSVGIPIEDVRNHPYVLRYKEETLEKAFVKSQEAGIVNITVLHLIHIIICKRVPLRPPRPKSTNFLPQILLGLSKAEMKKKFIHLRPLVTSNRLALKANLDFLIGEGFTVADVCTCPIILANKLEDLKETLKTLPLRPEMQNNSDLLENGAMKINLMQYFLEKGSNFRLSSVEIL